MNISDTLKSLLCNAEGEVIIEGSEEDKKQLQLAIKNIQELEKQIAEAKYCLSMWDMYDMICEEAKDKIISLNVTKALHALVLATINKKSKIIIDLQNIITTTGNEEAIQRMYEAF